MRVEGVDELGGVAEEVGVPRIRDIQDAHRLKRGGSEDPKIEDI